MTPCRVVYLFTALLAVQLYLPPFPEPAYADRQEAQEGEEVALSFRYQNAVNIYITAWYREETGEFLLPHTELFRALEIEADVDLGRQTVSGSAPGVGFYEIDYANGTADSEQTEISLQADQIHVGEFDFFIHPDVLFQLLGLDFQVDFGRLDLELTEAEIPIPVVERRERERRRERALRTEREITREFHPLRFDRSRHLFNAGFLDYNLGTNVSATGNTYTGQLSLGTEVLGGDLQGTLFGNLSSAGRTLRSSNLRWRYGVRENPWITRINLGQTAARGLQPVAYSGIQLTNEPIEPRYLFDDYLFTGTATPGAEVELYRNNVLLDFQQADEEGDYRFEIPLTYGTTRYRTQIFSPDGRTSERETRIQIPFAFAPPGEINYTLNAGQLDNPLPGTTDRGYMGQGEVRAGLSNRFTLSGAAEYFEAHHEDRPTLSAALTGRILDQYLVTLEAAEGVHYRANASVFYASGVNISLDYRHFLTDGGLYNRAGNRSRFQGSIYTPFSLGPVPFFFRTSVQHDQRISIDATRYRFDLNTRLGRANLRLSYRDTQFGRLEPVTTPSSRISGSLAYTVSRSRTAPTLLRGLFLRGQINWLPHNSEIDDIEAQISRRVLGEGRFQVGAGRNIRGGFNFFRFNLTFDFNRIRTNTTARASRGAYNVSHSFRGSVGLDTEHRNISFENRQQVGRSALAVRMFVDNTNTGTYEEGDRLLQESAIRIERGGGIVRQENGISYISQLQPYRRYNMTVNRNAIRDPLLVPQYDRFSVVTDPNQYKVIDIPLYTSGVLEGEITREIDGHHSPVGGARLHLTQTDSLPGREPHEEELRTFSDGSFYAYEIPPGEYELEIDPNQLQMLGLVADPERLRFRVQTVEGGDFIEELQMTLRPAPTEEIVLRDIEEMTRSAAAVEDYIIWDDQADSPVRSGRINSDSCHFTIQTGSYSTARRAVRASGADREWLNQEMGVYFNPLTRYFAVRTKTPLAFGEAAERILDTSSVPEREDLSLVWQCSEHQKNDRPEPVRYYLQQGAFSSRENAARLQSDLQQRADLETFVETDSEQGLYRVRSGPHPAAEALEWFNRLQAMDQLQGLFLIFPGIDDSPSLDFRYKLQVAMFESADQALSYSERLSKKRNLETFHLEDNLGRHYLLLEREFRRWSELLAVKRELSCLEDSLEPVIHLVEITSEEP